MRQRAISLDQLARGARERGFRDPGARRMLRDWLEALADAGFVVEVEPDLWAATDRGRAAFGDIDRFERHEEAA